MSIISKFFSWIKTKFLTIFGDIKVFSHPMFIVYDPSYYKMTGEKIRNAEKLLKPGDVICRGYDNYLDSYFIAMSSPDLFSHAGVYVGNNTVIHAMSPHVRKDDVIDFMLCDRIAIYRPKRGVKRAIKKAWKFYDDVVPYDFDFKIGNSSLYCFELAAKCYDFLNIPTFKASHLFGLIKRVVFFASSFEQSEDFIKIFEYNPKREVDFIIEQH